MPPCRSKAVAAATGSSATLGYALENAVDFVSSALVVWRFQGGGSTIPETVLEQREKRASIGIAISFVVLAVVVGSVAISHLSAKAEPHGVGALLGLAIPSVLIFGVLGGIKMKIGFATQSAAMKKDAACSLCGATLSLGVCFGVLFAEHTADIWWFDAFVAIVVSVGLLANGIYTLLKNAQRGDKWWEATFWGKPGRSKRFDVKIEANVAGGVDIAAGPPEFVVADDRG